MLIKLNSHMQKNKNNHWYTKYESYFKIYRKSLILDQNVKYIENFKECTLLTCFHKAFGDLTWAREIREK